MLFISNNAQPTYTTRWRGYQNSIQLYLTKETCRHRVLLIPLQFARHLSIDNFNKLGFEGSTANEESIDIVQSRFMEKRRQICRNERTQQ